MTLLRKTTSFLERNPDKRKEMKELQVSTEINLNILTGLGNVLAASSKDMDIDSEKEIADIDKNKVGRPFLIKIKGYHNAQCHHNVTFI